MSLATARPEGRRLADGRRLHLGHGPIDLVVEAFGEADQVAAAYDLAESRFRTILTELTAELPRLRRPVEDGEEPFEGTVARRMARAVGRFPGPFITPMAAVAGAVADEILSVMTAGADLAKAYVNNGGDIALHLSGVEVMRIGLLPEAVMLGEDSGTRGVATLRAGDGVGGIASSGAGGRSFSLGIADSVTVLATDASTADAAATLIANAVDVASPLIERRPADALDPDSDLGRRLVTRRVPTLPAAAVEAALDGGCRAAGAILTDGRIAAAALSLQGRYRTLGNAAAEAYLKLATPPENQR